MKINVKTKNSLIHIALLSLLPLLTISILPTFARTPGDFEPPSPSLTPERGSEPLSVPQPLMRSGFPALGPAANLGNLSPDLTAVITGQPGLSYRHVQTFGQTEIGYLTDNYHLNAPAGLFIDGSNSLYVLEDHGYRLLRYDSSASNPLAIGVPGLCVEGNNPTRFCSPRDAATDLSGNIWVATGHRVVKFNSSGTYLAQIPVPSSSGSWSSGVGTTHFKNASGVALDNTNGRLFVADRDNHRVQVYNINGDSPVYSGTIGVTGTPGSGATHFNKPTRLAVNSSGQLFVVDSGNSRIQRCTISVLWSCITFGSGYGIIKPEGIALDSSDQPHIYDSLAKRVIRCTAAGACSDLITNMDYAHDLAVDSSGNVYVGAYGHSVIRKYDINGNICG